MPYTEATKLVEHPVSCIDCHDAENMKPARQPPAFLNGIRCAGQVRLPHAAPAEHRALARDGRKGQYNPNIDATRQELRSLVCAQCHVEYYFKGEGSSSPTPGTRA
jgi:nitrite reductase (cytochrome c-552)